MQIIHLMASQYRVDVSHDFYMSSEKLSREISENIMVSEDLLEIKGLPSSFGWLAHFCTK